MQSKTRIDLTLPITPDMVKTAQANENKTFAGHLGTHFDVMDKEFPLPYTERAGIVFDVSGVGGRDIDCGDVDLSRVGADTFVAFYTGFIEAEGYGGKRYFTAHPQLSDALIDALLERNISIIGVDFAGVRRGSEHTPKDQYCAERGVFIVENLCNLSAVLRGEPYAVFTAHTYPMNYVGMTGLPCRVIGSLE
ncbi:MAG: cyclase family protein [Oscillospiraceae bacterium]|nr:cyclase family protein [Oscillospiraceae bacterium]